MWAFLYVVQCDHASILPRYGDIKLQTLDKRTHERAGDFILCPMPCIALDRHLLDGVEARMPTIDILKSLLMKLELPIV